MLKIPVCPSACELFLLVMILLMRSHQEHPKFRTTEVCWHHFLSSSPLVVVEILQSLHSLQQENQRLQDQILGLTAKKERLQLLNTELAVPFPPHSLSSQGSVHTSAQINFLSPIQGLSFKSRTVMQPLSILPLGSSAHTPLVLITSYLPRWCCRLG